MIYEAVIKIHDFVEKSAVVLCDNLMPNLVIGNDENIKFDILEIKEADGKLTRLKNLLSPNKDFIILYKTTL